MARVRGLDRAVAEAGRKGRDDDVLSSKDGVGRDEKKRSLGAA